KTATAALKHPSAAVRRAAVTVIPRDASSLVKILRQKLLQDTDAHVRLATLLAISEMPAAQPAGEAVFAMLQERRNSTDSWISDAATSAAARNDLSFLTAALSGLHPEQAQSKTASSLEEAGKVAERVAKHHAG